MSSGRNFTGAISKASAALIAYREWLKQNLPGMRKDFALGANAYGFFLHKVALLPYTPEQLLAMARQDFDRVLAFEAYERQRDINAPELKMAGSTEEEVARGTRDDEQIRQYLVAHQILSVPPDLPHWTLRPMPDYLLALEVSARSTTLAARRGCTTTERAGSCRRRIICHISSKPMHSIRAQRECTRACRDTSSSCRWRGEIRIRYGGSTTIRWPMRALDSTQKK